MTKNRTSVVVLLVISVVVLMFTNAVSYMMLLSKNEEWKSVVTETDNNTFELTEALAEHVYYDGNSIPCNQIVRHYSRFGKKSGSENLDDVQSGEKVVMLTQNGRIKTSFVVGQQTSEYANSFHEYLVEYFMKKK